MIKRTLYFGNPAYLSLKDNQIVIKLPELERNVTLPDVFKKNYVSTKPIEDIGFIIIDHKQITITSGLIDALLENNVAIITCDRKSLPTGMMLPLCGNTLQSERFRIQIDSSLPLRKQLWQQTIIAKIENQAKVLYRSRCVETRNMLKWASSVKSGDSDNLEARAAVYYWNNLFPKIDGFVRGREEMPPNNLLNYGYAILRAIIARALVSSGLMPTLGIHHHNKYNAYCLADDIMEPYRPFVDELVLHILEQEIDVSTLSKEIKLQLLSIPTIDVVINGKRSPLMVAATITTSSLYKCFAGEMKKIIYPKFNND